MTPPGLIRRFWRWVWAVLGSFRFAFAGLAALLRAERNAQVHLLAVAVVVLAGLLLGLERGEWLAVAVICAMVLALEAVNTAIEALVDLASPEVHPLARKAKDIGAAAVLIAAIGAIVVALLIVIPRL